MAYRVKRSFGPRHGARRKLVWARFILPATTVNLQTAQAPFRADLLSAFEASLGAQLIGTTIMRIRGVVRFGPSSAGNPIAVLAMRIADVTELAGASTASQNPTTNQTADWMAWLPCPTEVQAERDSSGVYAIDVKARRKLEELDQSFLLFVGGDSAAAATASMSLNLSMLLALP